MAERGAHDLIASIENAAPAEQWALLCYVAGQSVMLNADGLQASLRRAELLLAAGGDPRRPLDLSGRAVTALAQDIDTPGGRAALLAGLAALEPDAEDLPRTSEALTLLGGDPDVAWQCFAMALLAEALAGDADEPPDAPRPESPC